MLAAMGDSALEKTAAFILANDDFTLIAHVSPDGDTLGCTCALRLALIKLNKKVQAVCENAAPKIYRFLPGIDGLIAPENAIATSAAIAIDCADEGRMGAAKAIWDNAGHTANIDHHGTNTMYAQLNCVAPSAAAAAEVIFKLITLLQVDIDKDIATCLYCGLVTDTGNFAYSNTTEHTHYAAGKLMSLGADNALINRAVYRSAPISKRRMLGVGLVKAEYVFGGKIAYCLLTRADYAKFNAWDEDTEGIIDNLRDVESVEIAILIRETEDGAYKVSMRSKEYADVCAIAMLYGGGGHKQAAGCTVRGEISTISGELIELAKKAI